MTKPFSSEGYFPIHNYLFDVCMRELSNAGWRILCVAVRQTLGWVDEDSDTGRKQWDQISYSQFREKTGLASDSTIKRGIEECLEEGYLIRARSKGPHGNAYSLNRAFEDKHYRKCSASESTTETVEVSTTESVEVSTTLSVDTKENSLNETTKYSSAGAPDVPTSFEGWLKRVERPPKGSNRTAQLVAMFTALFPDKDTPDFGYMGKTARTVGGAGRMAALLWQSAGNRVTGDPLRYCLGIHRREKPKKRGGGNGKAEENTLSDSEAAEINAWFERVRARVEDGSPAAGA